MSSEGSSVQAVQIKVENIDNNMLDSIPIQRKYKPISATVKPDQFRALFLKNASIQRRRKGTNCCQLCLPITMIIIIGAVNVLLGNFASTDSSTEIQRGEAVPISTLTRKYNYYIFADETNSADLGNLPLEGEGSGILGLVPQSRRNPLNITLPYYEKYNSENDLNSELVNQKNALFGIRTQLSANNVDNRNYSLPTAAGVFTQVDLNALSFAYKVAYESDSTFVGLNGGVLGVDGISPVGSFMNYFHNAVLRYLLRSQNSTTLIETYVQQLPTYEQAASFDISGTLATVLLPFAMSFLLPIYVFNLVQEKEEKLIEMMKMGGVQMMGYYGVTYLFNLIIYLIIALLVILIGLCFQLPFFLKATGLLTFLVWLGWGLNQVSFAFTLSAFFSKARTSTVVSYLIVIGSILGSLICEFTVWADAEPNPAYYIWPFFAFYHYIAKLGGECGDLCPKSSDIAGSAYADIIVVLWVEAGLFFLIGIYLEAVFPKEFGVRKSVFYPFTDLYKWVRKIRKVEDDEEEVDFDEPNRDLELNDLNALQTEVKPIEDEDVAKERKKVEKMTKKDFHDHALVIKNLNKVYGPKIAVAKLSFSLSGNECFGLLGPNGAGKTTTISMCTGLYMPSRGTAYIDGYDIRTDMDQIHQTMGICPQFDILWDLLTCKETLLFYCRIKGVPREQEQEAAMDCLEQVGLQNASHKLVCELSGGMKRRLSVAVSLVGNPKVIFLDEPTTGLDPDSRRQLWNVLLQVRVGKCVVLTTHSMEEADVLCDRIGIMSQGALKVVGTNVRLKNKFGEGYSLKLNFEPESTAEIKEFVARVSPQAHLVEDFPGNYTYQISSNNFVMSQLLGELIENKPPAIKDWGLSQTTLEDVFLNIVKSDEHQSKP